MRQKLYSKMEEKNEELELLSQINMIENIAKKKMSKEAIARYGNLKVAHPEIAVKAISAIAQAVQTGYLKEQLSDDDFKDLLIELQRGKKELKLKR